ncbi:hypothetical protein VTL71DRAFT_12792 [Oculimacula yallundae]|uniref:VOC domain-containing protein n=1 Tax=Oculimacula yallundae TaxID=86028 RepID=A0ABR4CNH4_9HELO
MPISHVSLPSSSLPESTVFYLAALKPLGYGVFLELENQIGPVDEKDVDGKILRSKCVHVAFTGGSRGEMRRFWEEAIKAGGKDNGAPGERPQYPKGYYCAYVIDLEGNNIECAHYQPLWLSAVQRAPSILGVVLLGFWLGGLRGGMSLRKEMHEM